MTERDAGDRLVAADSLTFAEPPPREPHRRRPQRISRHPLRAHAHKPTPNPAKPLVDDPPHAVRRPPRHATPPAPPSAPPLPLSAHRPLQIPPSPRPAHHCSTPDPSLHQLLPVPGPDPAPAPLWWLGGVRARHRPQSPCSSRVGCGHNVHSRIHSSICAAHCSVSSEEPAERAGGTTPLRLPNSSKCSTERLCNAMQAAAVAVGVRRTAGNAAVHGMT